MKIDLALRALHRSELRLARDLRAVADRHVVEHEVHHVARDLARWCDSHADQLAEAGRDHGVHLNGRSAVAALVSPVLTTARRTVSEALGRRPEPGVLLLVDLRHLHRVSAGVSLDWELLAQGAQALRLTGLLELAQRCHPQTLRQLTWTNAMLKTHSPQVLAS